MIIYKATNLVNNKIYIGKTLFSLDKRKKRHISDSKSKKDRIAFHAAIRKYGAENFCWEVIDQCLFSESLSVLEIHYIKLYKSMGVGGYNLTVGGEGSTGRDIGKKLTEEHRRKLRENHPDYSGSNNPMYGKPAPNRGIPHSDAVREKMKKNHADFRGDKSPRFGKHLSDETKDKIKKSWVIRRTRQRVN